MSYHRDPEVNRAIIALLDALCMWERDSGNGSHLLLVPEENTRGTVYAMDGKPVSHTPFELGMDLDLLKTKILRGA